MADPTDRTDHLLLVQYLSPAFPVGAFAYSQGLESAIATGAVTTPAEVAQWVTDILTLGSGRMDAILLAQARHPAADLAALTDLAHALAPSAERHTEMTEQGRAFGLTLASLTGQDAPPLPYALAVGHGTSSLAVPTEAVLELWLMGLAGQILQAAVRFLPMGQTQAQAALSQLLPRITALARDCATAPLSALSSATFRADLAQMQHETLPTRIFRS